MATRDQPSAIVQRNDPKTRKEARKRILRGRTRTDSERVRLEIAQNGRSRNSEVDSLISSGHPLIHSLMKRTQCGVVILALFLCGCAAPEFQPYARHGVITKGMGG